MGSFGSIISVLVADIDDERTILFRHGRNAKADRESFAVVAIHRNVSSDGNIEWHIVGRREPQHDRRAFS